MEGYIVAVPDLLSGMASNGGDADSFASPQAISAALDHMDRTEIERRLKATRDYASSFPPPADRRRVLSSILLAPVATNVDAPLAGIHSGTFALNAESWPKAMTFLAVQTNNHPIAGANPNAPEDHSMHMAMGMHMPGMAMAQDAGKKGGRGPMGYPMAKLPDLPAGTFTAHSTIANSKLKKEFVDIPMGSVKLHTWVEYPDGDGKAPIVLVMQHGPGMDDWQRALADQLAVQGFIAIAADLHSGLGPNGGNYDSFGGTDEVMRSTARVNAGRAAGSLQGGREWGKKLPRWNGKSRDHRLLHGRRQQFPLRRRESRSERRRVFYGATPKKETL